MTPLQEKAAQEVLSAVIVEIEMLRRVLMLKRPYTVQLICERLQGFSNAIAAVLPERHERELAASSASSAPASGSGGALGVIVEKKKGKDGSG